jgi:4-hydroxy-tetrahydrodipicolinate reductase
MDLMNILLNGASGRMGNEIILAVKSQADMEIVCGFDREENFNEEFPIYNDIKNIKENVDVIIDFSVPTATFKILEYAKINKIPVVIATTGFSENEIEKIKDISKELPIFRSSNMSLEINLMASLVQKVAEVLSESDIEIIETHHTRKLDAPSGTAKMLFSAVQNVRKDAYANYGRSGLCKREKNEVGINSIRVGNIVGIHEVIVGTASEQITLKHEAYDRALFADGAIKAAEFMVGKGAGLYTMEELLKNH